jgi:hypothetical protein
MSEPGAGTPSTASDDSDPLREIVSAALVLCGVVEPVAGGQAPANQELAGFLVDALRTVYEATSDDEPVETWLADALDVSTQTRHHVELVLASRLSASALPSAPVDATSELSADEDAEDIKRSAAASRAFGSPPER